MELTRVGTPNTMFRRAREISEMAFHRRKEKERDNRENVEMLSPWQARCSLRNGGSLLSTMKFRVRFPTCGKFSRGRT